MSLTTKQLDKLARLVFDTEPEELDCDAVLELLAGYFEAHQDQSLPRPLEFQAVERHLRVCADCSEEFRALLEACGS